MHVKNKNSALVVFDVPFEDLFGMAKFIALQIADQATHIFNPAFTYNTGSISNEDFPLTGDGNTQLFENWIVFVNDILAVFFFLFTDQVPHLIELHGLHVDIGSVEINFTCFLQNFGFIVLNMVDYFSSSCDSL